MNICPSCKTAGMKVVNLTPHLPVVRRHSERHLPNPDIALECDCGNSINANKVLSLNEFSLVHKKRCDDVAELEVWLMIDESNTLVIMELDKVRDNADLIRVVGQDAHDKIRVMFPEVTSITSIVTTSDIDDDMNTYYDFNGDEYIIKYNDDCDRLAVYVGVKEYELADGE